MDNHAPSGPPELPFDPWDEAHAEAAGEQPYDAGGAFDSASPPQGPFAFDLPDPALADDQSASGNDAAEVLHMERKLPRHLQLWFAGGLALVTLGVLALQSWLLHPATPAAVTGTSGTPSRDAEPPLLALQRELAREKGEGGQVGPLSSPWPGPRPALPGRAARSSAQALAAPVPVPGGTLLPGTAPAGFPIEVPPTTPDGLAGAIPAGLPGSAPGGVSEGVPSTFPGAIPGRTPGTGAVDLPPELLPDPASTGERAYEQAKAQAVIAGSRILALSHAPATPMAGEAVGAPVTDRTQLLASLLHSAPDLLRSLPELLGASREGLAGLSGAASVVPTGAAATGSGARVAAETAATAMALRGQDSHAGASALLQPGPPPGAPVILEGTPIPCVLQTEIRSDLPGMIVAQVADDVYDSVTAQRRLIPRGTRLVGHYDSQVAGGQQRLLASFHRLILPDGASLDLPRMEAADVAGSAGLEDQVDTHFLARFGTSFLTAGLARAAQRDGSPVASSVPGGVLPGPDATGQILVDTARTSLQMGTTVAPTLIIRRGTQFNVMVNRDLRLPELPSP